MPTPASFHLTSLVKLSIRTFFILILFLSAQISQADITVFNTDSNGTGLSDSTAVDPVGGNPGTTIGQQRLNALQQAADIIDLYFEIDIPITIEASFQRLECNQNTALLGTAGPDNYQFEQVNNEWFVYPDALYNQLVGRDVDSSAEISARFNENLGQPNCLSGSNWYYGYDQAPVGDNSLLSVALHEFIHGMGLLTLLKRDGSSSATIDSGREDILDPYSRRLKHLPSNTLLKDMNRADRSNVLTDANNVVFVGDSTDAQANRYESGYRDGHVLIDTRREYLEGSSVSHYAVSVSPSEVMEASYSGFYDKPGLAIFTLADIGWTLSRAATNIAPEWQMDDLLKISEDDQQNFSLNARDADSDRLTFKIISASAQLGASVFNNQLSLNPAADFFGQGELILSVSDGIADIEKQFNVDVLPVNDAPVWTTINNIEMPEDSQRSIRMTASDIDGDLLNFSIKTQSANIKTSINNNSLSIEPNIDFFGVDTIVLTVTDGLISTDLEMTINVENINDRPIISAIPNQSVDDDGQKIVMLNIFDADNDALSVQVGGYDTNRLNITLDSTRMTLTPINEPNGSTDITVTVGDGQLASSTSFTLSFANGNLNSAPRIESAENIITTVGREASAVINVSDDDPFEQFNIVIDHHETPKHLNATTDNNEIRVNPSVPGQYRVAFVASDDTSSSTGYIDVTVYAEISASVINENDTLSNTFTLYSDQHTGIQNSDVLIAIDGGAGDWTLELDYLNESRPDLLTLIENNNDTTEAVYQLSMPDSGAFAGRYTITITDRLGHSTVKTFVRDPRIQIGTDTIINGQYTPVSIEGLPSDTEIFISSDQPNVVWLDDNQSNLNRILVPSTPAEFNCVNLSLLSENTDTGLSDISISSNLPDDGQFNLTETITYTSLQTVSITLFDTSFSTVTDSLLVFNDERFSVWELAEQYRPDAQGVITLTLPAIALEAYVLSADYPDQKINISPFNTDFSVILGLVDVRFSLNVTVVAQDISFDNQLPEISIGFEDGRRQTLPADLNNFGQAYTTWTTDFSEGKPVDVRVSHPQAALITKTINTDQDEENILVELDSASLSNNQRSESSGGGSSSCLTLLALLSLLKLRRAAKSFTA